MYPTGEDTGEELEPIPRHFPNVCLICFNPGFYQSIGLRSGASKEKSINPPRCRLLRFHQEKSGHRAQSIDFTYPRNIFRFSGQPFLVPNFCSCISSYPFCFSHTTSACHLRIPDPFALHSCDREEAETRGEIRRGRTGSMRYTSPGGPPIILSPQSFVQSGYQKPIYNYD